MGKGVFKFINYTKEAFFWPFHLVSFGLLAVMTVAGLIALPELFGMDSTGLLFIFGGLEMVQLAMITRSRRFRRAINAKYAHELEAYAYLKKLTDTYNGLSAASQRRFEALRLKLNETKKNYATLNRSVPDLIRDYHQKIDALQMNFIRLLSAHDNFPALLKKENPTQIKQRIEDLRTGMGDDSEKLRQVKEKRIRLLQKRLRNLNDAFENRQVIEQQLKTIEEMISFFAEQPLTEHTKDEADIIDSLLDETNDLNDTLGEVEDIMRSEVSTPEFQTGSGGAYSSQEIY